MKPLCVSSNMLNERSQLDEWFDFVKQIADGGILIVDGGSTDGTIEYAKDKGAIVIIDNIIQCEGYGPARNHLRQMTREYFPKSHWMLYLDGDERIDSEDFHRLRFLKDYLIDDFDVIALPRIDWMDLGKATAAKDWHVNPDWQARMTRLNSPLSYVRRLHEQLINQKGIYINMSNPKIHHFHRSAGQQKRDHVGKLCAKLHSEDIEWGHTYPQHHKEEYYFKRFKEEGL